MARATFDPDFIDWDAYQNAVYSPPPALMALPEWPLIRSGWGGRGFGFDELDERAARARGEDLP